MPFLILQSVTTQNVNGDTFTHEPGTVVSDWEVSDFIKGKIKEGSAHYRGLFEPLTDEEAKHHRVKATIAAGPRYKDGQELTAPWEDYVGLHPEEIIDRMRGSSSSTEVNAIKQFERAGMNRGMVVHFTAPVEREPFVGYDEMHVREVLSKLAILSDRDVQDVINYELAHRRRPAIVQYEREEVEGPESEPVEDEVPAAV